MTLGEIIKKYRSNHDLSMQEFADMCGMSKANISLLEKGVRNGKPISPSRGTVDQTARAMGMRGADLWDLIDDYPLDWDSTISNEEPTEDELDLHDLLWHGQQLTRKKQHVASYPYKKELDEVLQKLTGAQLKQVLTFARFLKQEGDND